MRSVGAKWYKIFIDNKPTPEYVSWNNYKWVGTSFELRAVAPDALGRYAVPSILDLWAIDDLGFVWDTEVLSNNNLHNLKVVLYASSGLPILLPAFKQMKENINILVDNTQPEVRINSIYHDGAPVDACGLLTTGSSNLVFNITAYSQTGYLHSWSFVDEYGHGSSKSIASDAYEPTHSLSTFWSGVKSDLHSWDLCESSTQCAHEFRLGAWGRSTNGYGYLYYQSDFETLAVYLPAGTCA
jgi:hypothetical protein